jgi:ribosome-associated toxin RatA of RatAB toxin-antitoxin module
MKLALFLLLSLTLGGTALGGEADPGPGLSAADLKRLAAGEVLVNSQPVPGEDVPESTMYVVIEAPPQRVWSVVKDCAHYKRTMPRIAESKMVKTEGKFVTCQVTADLPFPLSDITSTTLGVHTERDGFWQRKWDLIKGDYKINRGAWTLRYFNNNKERTLASYRLLAVPNVPLPKSILNAAQSRTLPGLAKRLRAEIAARAPKDQ